MSSISLSLALLLFAIPGFSQAQSTTLVRSLGKQGLPNNLNAQGQGIYSNLVWEFNILTEAILKNDSTRCAIQIERTPDTNSVLVSLTVGDISDQVVIDGTWENSSVDISKDYDHQYSTEYLTASRCLFQKSVVLGTPRGISNSITYNVNLSCPKGHKVQKIYSCNFN